MRPAEPALENYANNSSPTGRNKPRRYVLRGLQWEVSVLDRVRKCGRVMTGQHVGVRTSPGLGSGFSGLVTCGSIWVCPVCSAKIMAKRSLEIGLALTTWGSRGGDVAFGTFTMRHDRGMRLADVWDAIGKAWASFQSGKAYRDWSARLGLGGVIKVVEVNIGPNGWHVHIHALFLVRSGITPAELDAFKSWAFAKWDRALGRNGYPGALPAGQELHLLDSLVAVGTISEYLVKATAYGTPEAVGRELTGSLTKATRGVHATHPAWSLLETFGETGEVELLDLWHEYERASKGRRQISWSKGLREQLGIGAEATDEEVAAEEHGDEDLVLITRAGWATVIAMMRAGVPSQPEILEAAEQGPGPLRDYLRSAGIEFMEVGQVAK